MAGAEVHHAPESHQCPVWAVGGADPGDVWQCGPCGGYWRLERVAVPGAVSWYRLRGIRLWLWKRQVRHLMG